jgi:hypothetical protein
LLQRIVDGFPGSGLEIGFHFRDAGWHHQRMGARSKRQPVAIVVDNSASKAMYTGLAITSNPSGNFLYAADNTNNHIDMFDGTFTRVKSFGDPAIPSTFSVFGIQDINGLVYVTYAVPNIGAGGYVDLFKEDGTFVKTLIQGLPLNQAWGVAAAPPNFGPLSNTLLVSNNSVHGTINAFDAVTGEFVGTIRDEHGKKIVLNNLWGVAFGGGTTANGAANELFVTVGQGIGTANWPVPSQKSSSRDSPRAKEAPRVLSGAAKAPLLLEPLGKKNFEQGPIGYVPFVGQDFKVLDHGDRQACRNCAQRRLEVGQFGALRFGPVNKRG